MRAVRLLAALVAAAGASLLAAGPAWAVAPSQTGWWWQAQSTPLSLPTPPTVPDGGLMVSDVQGDPDGATAISALRYDLTADDESPALTLHVPSGSFDANAAIVACPATRPWGAASAGAWSVRPTSDCTTHADGTQSADGTTWTFSLGPLAHTNEDGSATLDVVLLPAHDSTFQITFDKPDANVLATTPKPATVTVPDVGPAPDLAAAPAVATPSPTAAPPLAAPVLAPSVAAPLPTPGAARVAPGVATPPATSQPVAAAVRVPRHAGKPLLAVGVLLAAGAAALWAYRQPAPALRRLGSFAHDAPAAGAHRPGRAGAALAGLRGEHQVGGLGRFARPRRETAPRLT